MRFIKKVMERGTVTLPSDVREALDVKEGDIVEFEIVSVVKKGPGAETASAKPAPPPSAPSRPNPSNRPTQA